jgi:nucleoside-diphosphate-sugar epimerase
MGSDSSIGRQIAEELKNDFKVIGMARKPPENAPIPTYQYELRSLDADSLPKITADFCIMLSSITDMDVCEDRPIEAFDTNVAGVMRAIRFLKAHNIRQLIYFSTGIVCSGIDTPMNEDCIPHPPNIYALTKHLAEQTLKHHHEDLQTLAIRPFFIYGPETRKNRLFFNLISDIVAGRGVRLHKDSKPYINPIYIGDAVKIIRAVLEKGLPGNFECLNLAGNEVASIKELALMIGEVLNRKAEFVQMDSAHHEIIAEISKTRSYYDYEFRFTKNPYNIIADISKLRSFYDYEFRYTLKYGIEETVRWMRARGMI